VFSWIRIYDLSNQTALDIRFRPHGHQGRQFYSYKSVNLVLSYSYNKTLWSRTKHWFTFPSGSTNKSISWGRHFLSLCWRDWMYLAATLLFLFPDTIARPFSVWRNEQCHSALTFKHSVWWRSIIKPFLFLYRLYAGSR